MQEIQSKVCGINIFTKISMANVRPTANQDSTFLSFCIKHGCIS